MRKNRKRNRRKNKSHAREDMQLATSPPSSPSPSPTTPKLHTDPARIAKYASAAVFVALAYLAFVNLDWALFWDDEATMAYLARNWLEFGAPLVDDGRNVFSFRYGADISADGTFNYPQLVLALQAAMFFIFGEGEIQVRVISGVFSLAAMALFYDILRREFPGRHGFIAVAFALACLSPIIIGYARSATYNALVLFFHVLVFHSYVRFCARKSVIDACVLTAAAILAFHTHYLSNLIFMSALFCVHVLFRLRDFDRRAWLIAFAAGSVYAAQVGWIYFFEYDAASYGAHSAGGSMRHFIRTAQENFRMLNINNMLAWSIALWFIVRRAAVQLKRAYTAWNARRRKMPPVEMETETAAADSRVTQYFVFVLIGVVVLSLFWRFVSPGHVRHFYSFAPFAAVIGAAAVCWLWRILKVGAVALAAALLLSDVAGWPFLDNYEYRGKPSWTVPVLAAEYHRDYPDAMRESFAYIRERLEPNALIYSTYTNSGKMLWYLSDHVLICCKLSQKYAGPISTDGRDYLIFENAVANASDVNHPLTPKYLYHWWKGQPAVKTWVPNGPDYHRLKDFPTVMIGVGPLSRPEPAWHVSRPDRMRNRRDLDRMQLYKLER